MSNPAKTLAIGLALSIVGWVLILLLVRALVS